MKMIYIGQIRMMIAEAYFNHLSEGTCTTYGEPMNPVVEYITEEAPDQKEIDRREQNKKQQRDLARMGRRKKLPPGWRR